MALGFNLETKSGGDILPIVKWDAKAGDLIKQDRYQAADGTWQKDEQELRTSHLGRHGLGEHRGRMALVRRRRA